MRRAERDPITRRTKRCVCGKKKSTKEQAKKEARFLKYHKKYSGLIPMVYKCKFSGWYHVGNSV